jgi:hypothetical protein
MLRKPIFQNIFFRGMCLLGMIGCGISFWAFSFRLYMDSKVFLTRVESKEESRALPRFLTL